MFGDDTSGAFTDGVRNYAESTFSTVTPSSYYTNCYMDSKLIGFMIAYDLQMNEQNRFPRSNNFIFGSSTDKRKYYSTSGILVCRSNNGVGLSAAFKLLGGGVDPKGGHNHGNFLFSHFKSKSLKKYQMFFNIR